MSKTTQADVAALTAKLREAKRSIENLQTALKEVENDREHFRVFVKDMHSLNIKCLKENKYVDVEWSVKKSSTLLNKVKPFYLGL